MYSVAAHPRVNEAGHATWDRVWKSELAYWLELGSMSSMLLQCHPIHQSKDVDCRAKVGGWVEHAAERSVELETAERCAGREDAPRQQPHQTRGVEAGGRADAAPARHTHVAHSPTAQH